MRLAVSLIACLLATVGCEVAPVEAPASASDSSAPPIDPLFEVLPGVRPAESVLDSFVGCYEFGVDVRSLSQTEDGSTVRAELRKVQLREPNRFELILRPEPRQRPHWSVTRKGEAVFWWSTMFMGVTFKLLPGDDIPTALVDRFSDTEFDENYSEVRVQRIQCPI